ncbi:hypothetical protein [Flavobacterium phage FCOV-F14]|uniref:Uncharacterized protein n=8 Tax=Ficleduovirus FCL2 TaxID=2560473 RepID=A0A0A0YV02_9CAUD|nr:hypothetical protein ABG42_gp46 [Flavobacterium phage FCL-2]QCW21157.1 hypothetical protein [Flavobacterium phage FCOV-F13]QCW21231.1 hypothetical protein [Flavobacterium phage FCOV-F16]QCW21533.1 hypothetical protein [Flavobacterium phage FCOV-F45]QCW21607.1 hypothetical protein [Flavobacterium phage FCOV-F46]QCW21681.1 hypothetical protein [Flavobacterium phage FCOV-F54]QCW21752.1 hypothetical protein [Flavobacterium phage FCOV-S1]QCW21826.1 hypothetical protein [Flavobacterium phage FC
MENTYSFYATLTANVFLNDNDFYFLYDCCKNHYDFTVRMSNEICGFLYGFKVRRTPIKGLDVTNDDRIVEFTSRKLGLIMKALEMQSSEQASRLNLLFHKVASEMSISQQSINKNIIGLTNI